MGQYDVQTVGDGYPVPYPVYKVTASVGGEAKNKEESLKSEICTNKGKQKIPIVPTAASKTSA
jgi:hypothetical protein